MKLKENTVNEIKGLDRPFSLKGAAAATGKSYLTIRKYVQILLDQNVLKEVGEFHNGEKGRPSPLYGNVRINGRFASYKDKQPIL